MYCVRENNVNVHLQRNRMYTYLLIASSAWRARLTRACLCCIERTAALEPPSRRVLTILEDRITRAMSRRAWESANSSSNTARARNKRDSRVFIFTRKNTTKENRKRHTAKDYMTWRFGHERNSNPPLRRTAACTGRFILWVTSK